MFSRPTDAERERLRDDLLHRAELVRTMLNYIVPLGNSPQVDVISVTSSWLGLAAGEQHVYEDPYGAALLRFSRPLDEAGYAVSCAAPRRRT
jgi:hypothetical protein